MLLYNRDTGEWTFTSGAAGLAFFEETLEAYAKEFNYTPKMTVLDFIKKSRK